MDVKNLVPWSRKHSPSDRPAEEGNPLMALHTEMNRLFDDFFHGFDVSPSRYSWSSGWPKLDVVEEADAMKVSAELPGMEEKDISVTLHEGVLTISGEKKSESRNARYSECWYGDFQRSIKLGSDIDADKVAATFKNGVLTITVQKKPESQRTEKKIAINA